MYSSTGFPDSPTSDRLGPTSFQTWRHGARPYAATYAADNGEAFVRSLPRHSLVADLGCGPGSLDAQGVEVVGCRDMRGVGHVR